MFFLACAASCPLLFSFSNSLLASPLPKQNAVPGGAVAVPFAWEKAQTPYVEYRDRRVMAIKHEQQWYAVIGIPLNARAGEHQFSVRESANTKAQTQSFTVNAKEYEAQYLTIKNKRKVNPNPDDLKRIRKEKKRITQAFQSWTTANTPNLKFLRPAEGPMSSPFGLRRFFNQQPRKPHSGLDIAAPIGSPIVAPEGGTVVTVGDFFFNGKSVFIDHGYGLVTMYCHMDRIDVEEGQSIKRGEQLGTIGKSGRVTGPHLHWSVSLNNTRVDPILFID